MQFFVSKYTQPGLMFLTVDQTSLEASLNVLDSSALDARFTILNKAKTKLFCINKINNGSVSMYQINNDDTITLLDQISIDSKGPTHLCLNSNESILFTANYHSEAYSQIEIIDQKFGQVTTHKFDGSSVHPVRQTKSHPHFVSCVDEVVQIVDLGMDVIHRFELATKSYSQIKTKAGSGPRHLIYLDETNFFCLSELTGTLTHYQGTKLLKEYVFLDEEAQIEAYGGAIKLSNDKKMLVVSIRKTNQLFWFKVNEQTIELIGNCDVEGQNTRDFEFSVDDNYLLVANIDSNDITIFKVDTTNQTIEFTNKKISCDAPVCLSAYK
ncbi:MAG: lactonase family protein [Mycoplasmatales bacterium]